MAAVLAPPRCSRLTGSASAARFLPPRECPRRPLSLRTLATPPGDRGRQPDCDNSLSRDRPWWNLPRPRPHRPRSSGPPSPTPPAAGSRPRRSRWGSGATLVFWWYPFGMSLCAVGLVLGLISLALGYPGRQGPARTLGLARGDLQLDRAGAVGRPSTGSCSSPSRGATGGSTTDPVRPRTIVARRPPRPS